MPLPKEQRLVLERFMDRSDFSKGSAILDLDGTALHEEQGKVFISGSVENGISAIVEIGRPVIINTLRFPLSVIRNVATEWLHITNKKIPAVLLNGSVLGYIEMNGGAPIWKEISATPISPKEINELIFGLDELVFHDIRDLILFFYPRDWKKGEIIWMPHESNTEDVFRRYKTSSRIGFWSTAELKEIMLENEVCMAVLLVNHPKDKLMAYQHNKPSSFFTSKGISKSAGLKNMANILDISLLDSIGAGDSEMDSFLGDVGLAAIVGDEQISWAGIKETIRVKSPSVLGDLLCDLSEIACLKFLK